MFAIAARIVAATAAAAVVVAAGLWSVSSAGDDLQFSTVLANFSEADTVQMEVTTDGKASQVWAKQPGKLRWNHPDGTYSIARGERTWLVDEKANRAASAPSSYFLQGQAGLDAMALLDLPADADRKGISSALPVEQVERDGRRCDVYRMELAAREGAIRIEALVDAESRMLRTVTSSPQRLGVRPICKIEVVAVGKPVDESLFVVGDTLTEDGRVGKVADVQGIVSVKPVMARRWTPLATHMLIKPGDWVRTDARGANAVLLRLVKATEVTLGPGSLLEVVRPNQIRMVHGILKVVAEDSAPVELLGPRDQKIEVKGTAIYRLGEGEDAEKLVRLEKPPLWLQGFEGATANESLGSLIATVEGRNVPLTVGYHKVTVEIRDQIARTVIEESFVNHIDHGPPLEGIFYFPLPQDASISGFGMWIGNELVEADVVEKQRAREIYETILRERRDPGLLEWTGGNIFKARVFPIPPGGEKRIKISYTQVLPLQGNQYRYSYALRSEMLRQHPLRELAIDLKLNSVMPLAGVSSPTHTAARIDRTERSGHVEFAAQEYTPTSDFEVVVDLAGSQSNVVMIPHRRGEDGYFMLLLTPPDGEGQWQREIPPEGKPLELLILADTSGSIDADGRKVQAELIASLLSSLTPEDKLNLACCDVDCTWAFEAPVPATEENVQKARDALDARVSLGWTDLDKAFAAALKQIGGQGSKAETHVIYVGDGIVTTRDADPVDFARRLKLLCEGKDAALHAISVSSSFEPVVMRAIASLGGGSVRQVSGERTPQVVARELLDELSKPTLRDLKVEFRGIRTARVYPEQLPNLPAGTQQVLLGRYLPLSGGADQQGEVVVTGVQGGKPLRFSTRVSLKDAEEGNSFIPRLWARMHLDALLAQGATSVVRDEIIALSEEYHIITPYTSLLVLESDADRERFKVKRRFQMRDAERFFAEGTDTANYELLQQQMIRAGDWRESLRRDVLGQLLGLGRDINAFQLARDAERYNVDGRRGRQLQAAIGPVKVSGSMNALVLRGSISTMAPEPRTPYFLSEAEVNGRKSGSSVISNEQNDDLYAFAADQYGKPKSDLSDFLNADKFEQADFGFDMKDYQSPSQPVVNGQDSTYWDLDSLDVRADAFSLSSTAAARPMASGAMGGFGGGMGARGGLAENTRMGETAHRYLTAMDVAGYWPGQYTSWLGTLFPGLPAAPQEEKPFEPKKPWPQEARALVESLLRTKQLAALEGGLSIKRQADGFDPRWDKLTSRSQTVELVSPRAWLVRSGGYGSPTNVQWCDENERGILSRAFKLGRLRKSTPLDLSKPPLGLPGHTQTSLERNYQGYTPELRPQADDQTLLVLTNPDNPDYEVHYLVDTARKVLLAIEYHSEGKVTSTIKYDRFVEIAGSWYAGRSQTFDEKGRRTAETSEEFQLLSADAFDTQMQEQLSGRDRVQLLHEPLLKLADAKRALADGKAGFDEQMTLLLHFCDTQQWDRVLEHLELAEKLAVDKPGMRWVRNAILNNARRREDLRQRLLGEAAGLANTEAAEAFFLANYLLNQSSGNLETNERMALQDVLKPVYQAQPEYLEAMKQWGRDRVNNLQGTGRPDEALKLQRQLAEEYPHDSGLQQQYANMLRNAGEYEAAYAWLDRVISDEAQWRPYEEDSLRQTYTQLLRNQGRWPDLAEYAAAWVAKNPDGNPAYQQYLGSLIHTDQVDKAEALMAQWLKEGRQEGTRPAAVASRFDAAVRQALGQGYETYTNRIEEKWFDPLAEVVRFFARQEDMPYVINQIMAQGQFQQTDQCRQLRREFVGILRRDIETLKPQQIQRLIDWIWPNDPAVEQDVWRRIAEVLEKRWADEANPEMKNQYAGQLIRILSAGKLEAGAHLAFLRRQLAEGPEKYRASYARQLFDVLLAQSWSAEYEDEAFGLLEKLSDSEDATERLATAVQALYQLTDRMVQARYGAAMLQIEHQEELTRTELSDKQRENQRLAREGFAARLKKAREETEGGLKPWLNIERLYLETLMGQDLDKVAEECWETLGPKPPAPPAADAEPSLADALNEVLRSRCLVTLANLAARKEAKPELIDRLLGYVDAAIAQAPPEDTGWKLLKYQLLVALDRPKDIEKDLRQWLRADDPMNYWRISLGYLLAEQGLAKIPEAVTLFEAVEAEDELGPTEYRTLADWYMVLDRRDDYEQALIDVFKTTEEYRLQQWLSQQLRPWQRRDAQLPAEMDKDVLRVFAALFQKSGSPQNHLWRLREFYQATRDFRLLTGLADAVIGHTAGRVYPFLQGMDQVFAEIREEATVDEVIARIQQVRKRAETVVDRRALDLLEAIVERRAAELQNQPGPHAQRAVAALKRAFRPEWSPGEPRLMADLLAGMGAITNPELAALQISQLQVLHEGAAEGSLDRLHIGHCRARCLWGHGRRIEAVDLLDSALKEYQAAQSGVLPTEANGPLETLVSYLRSDGHFARGEQVLFEQFEHPVNQQQTYWLKDQLYQLYCDAIRSDGQASLGRGQELYEAVQEKIQVELDTPDENHRRNLVSRLCDVYHRARDRKLEGWADDLRAFAFKRLPEVIVRQTNDIQSIVGQVASTIRELVGPELALEFLVERIEKEPSWLRYNNQDGWGRHGYQLAQWRAQAKQLDPGLEERLLVIVLAELRRDLESRQNRNRSMYWRPNSYYWQEKEQDFRRVAEEVYQERKGSGAAVKYIAEYLYHGLNHYNRAIEILFVAHGEKLLDEDGQSTLVQYLHWQNRHGESIALLVPLVELRPENMQYRVWLMHAYFRSNRPAELLALLKQTDEYFHKEGRWTEGPMAALAASCLENQLYEQSVTYYEELIPLHQRTQPNRGIGNGTLSDYYGRMAQAYAGLKNTAKAVDAACGAIVSWGPTHQNRAQAIRALQDVLRQAPDLDAYVTGLDKEVEESDGLDKPIVRKALGIVYAEKEQFAKAIAQLELACRGEPNDTETHQKLVECYDKQGDKAGALRQLLSSVELSRRDIQLYKDLGQRFGQLERPGDVERAYTSIVEMLPTESESHTMLAEIRQQQDRWDEAIDEWHRVAAIRELEPTGLLKLAEAQIHQKQWDAASETVRALDLKDWPSRFGDVRDQVRRLQRQIDQGREMR